MQTLRRPWWRGLLEDWSAVSAFPHVPLAGTSLNDYDAWTLDALLVLQAEEHFIRAAASQG